MHKFFGLMHSMLADNYTGYVTHPGDVFDAQWGRARFQDMMITLQWMYENYPENNTQILLDNMNTSTIKPSIGLLGIIRIRSSSKTWIPFRSI
jgi:hypothetical protein